MSVDREQLKDLFVALSDRTREIDKVTFHIFCDHFDEEEMRTETVALGLTWLVKHWEKSWWPSPEVVVSTARRAWQEKFGTPNAVDIGKKVTEHAIAEDEAKREADRKRARDWAKAHPEEFKLVKHRVYAEFATDSRSEKATKFYEIARDERLMIECVRAAERDTAVNTAVGNNLDAAGVAAATITRRKVR